MTCCNYAVVTWSLDDGETPNWEFSAPEGADYGWTVTHERAATFPYSIHAGGGGVPTLVEENAATAETQMLDIPLVSELRVRFWLYLDLDPWTDADHVMISGVSPDNKELILWEKTGGMPQKEWMWMDVDASFFIAEGGMQLVLSYDPLSLGGGDGEGVYIDQLEVYVPCAAGSCADDSECDDGDPSTTDTCDGGLCKSTPKLWYCDEDTDCEDLKLCTEHICFAETCQIYSVPDCCEGVEECDDLNLCTTDVCNGLDGCAYENNTLTCDDSDGCTEGDICGDGMCMGQPVNCDDGTGCSEGICADDNCSYVFVNNPGCCDKNQAEHAFSEALDQSGWAVVSDNDDVLWQVSSAKFTTGPSSLYYGNVSQQDYDNGKKNEGSATSPSVWLPNAVTTYARFLIYMDVEEDAEFDVMTVSVVTAGENGEEVTDIWAKPADFPMLEFTELEISLDAWQGQTISLRFTFDTQDAAANQREGVYIDDLRFYVACPQQECVTTADCDDGNPCTLDECVPGETSSVCVPTPVAGCCQVDADCDDFNFCTVDSCNAGVCETQQVEGCCFSSADCEDGNPCTTDVCDPVLGCFHSDNTNFCSDGDACTKNDTCFEGECAGVPLNCDDGDDLCTNDICKNGTCVHEPTGAAGCCETDEDCDDNDTCTEDSCNDGMCLSVNLCCQSDAECNDLDDICTIDLCVDGDCLYQATDAPGCCTPIVYDEGFTEPGNGDFSFGGSNALSKWQVLSNAKFQTPASALYYGNPSQMNFNNGASNGTATSPSISLPNKNGISLTFWVWMNTESGTTYDKLFLYAKSGGSQSTVWNKSSYISGGMSQWKQQTVNLDAYKGQTIQLQWYFDTVDSIANYGEGVYIDDIQITVPCP